MFDLIPTQKTENIQAWSSMKVIPRAILITWRSWEDENKARVSFWRYRAICESALNKVGEDKHKVAKAYPEYEEVREYFLSKWLKGGAK